MDNALVHGALAGDQAAFGALVRKHYGAVYGIAFSQIGDWDSARDLTQETFLVAWVNLKRLRRADAFAGWLHQIARNLALNWIRSAAYRRRFIERREPVETSASADAQLIEADKKAEVWRAVESLSPTLREAVVLFYLEGQSVAQVAQILGTTENTIKKRMQHARPKLRSYFEKQWESEFAHVRKHMQGAVAVMSALPMGPLDPATGSAAAAVSFVSQFAQWTTLANVVAMTAKGKAIAGAAALLLALLLTQPLWKAGSPTPAPPPTVAPAPTVEVKNDNADEPVAPSPTTNVASPAGPAGAFAAAEASTNPAPVVLEPKRIEDPDAHARVEGRVVVQKGQSGEATVETPIQITLYATGLDEQMMLLPDMYALAKAQPGASSESLRNAAMNAQRRNRLPSDDERAQWNATTRAWLEPKQQYTTTADAEGNFVIDNIAFEGVAIVKATANGFQDGTTSVYIVPKETQQVEIRVKNGATFSGRVLTASGKAVDRARVSMGLWISRVDGSGGTMRNDFDWGLTDAAGRFTLTCPGDGFALLHAVSDEYGDAVFTGIGVYEGADVELRMPEMARMHGTILGHDGKPTKNVKARLSAAMNFDLKPNADGGPSFASSYSSSDEDRTLTIGVDGTYAVDRLDPARENYWIHFVSADNQDLYSQLIPKFSPGEDRESNFKLNAPLTIRGIVVARESKRPIANARVMCLRRDGTEDRSPTIFSDAEGRFESVVLTGPGEYNVTAYYISPANMSGESDEEHVVADLQSGKPAEVTLTLADPWMAQFMLTDQSGAPISGATCSIGKVKPNSEIWSNASAVSDETGLIVIDSLRPDDELVVRFQADGYMDESSKPIIGTLGESRAPETVVMYRATDIRGVLMGPGGSPLADTAFECIVRYGEDLQQTLRSTTDPQGIFALANVPATTLTLEWQAPKRDEAGTSYAAPESEPVEAREDEVLDLGSIRLEVVD